MRRFFYVSSIEKLLNDLPIHEQLKIKISKFTRLALSRGSVVFEFLLCVLL
nr:MAG TPA: hypothetical protein [Caudoviricetes sp.]